MKTLLKQSKLIEKLILDEDEDISLNESENIGESKILKEEQCQKEYNVKYYTSSGRPGSIIVKACNEEEAEQIAIDEMNNDINSDFVNPESIYHVSEMTDESLKEAKVDFVKTDKYGKYGTEVKIYQCEGDEITPKGFTATVKGKTLNSDTLDGLEKQIIDEINSEDKKADNTILNDSLKEDVEEELSDEEYYDLVDNASYNQCLELDGIYPNGYNLIRDVYKNLKLKPSADWIVHPDVLLDDEAMKLLYTTLKKEIINKLNENPYYFDTERDEYYGTHNGTEEVVELFDIKKKIIYEELLKESEKNDLIELEEPIDEEPIETETTEIEEPVEPVTQEMADNAYLTQLNDLITSEYGKIDEVKSIIATFISEDAIESNSEVISILNAFIDETTIGIGMLTKASELIDSTTSELMQQGIDKAEEVINNEEQEEEVKEEE